jgi:hypothetical protein
LSSIGKTAGIPPVELGAPVIEIGYQPNQVGVSISWADPETQIVFPLSIEQARRISLSLEEAANKAEDADDESVTLH